MKRTILALVVCTVASGVLLTNCRTPAQKVENAKEDVKDANQNLAEATEDYQADLENYRKETADRIAANNKIIDDFNVRISNERKDAKAAYQKRLNELKQKNSDMKRKLDEYTAGGKDDWKKFKTEFNHDMDELGKAFKDLTKDNVN